MTKISKETQEQAHIVAKGTKRPKQTKEQTKLIAQGIEKGIAEYKKQQNKKSRERDKIRKMNLKTKVGQLETVNIVPQKTNRLPWILLVVSWIIFISWSALN